MNKIVSFCDAHDEPYLRITEPLMRAYAKRHGYAVEITHFKSAEAYFVQLARSMKVPAPWARHPVWYKLLELVRALDDSGTDVVVWLDADVVVSPWADDCLDQIGDCWQALAEHTAGWGKHFNHGVWMLRKQMIPWLLRAWADTACLAHLWREQLAMLKLLGWDVDKGIDKGPIHKSELLQQTRTMDKSFNWCPGDAEKGRKIQFAHAAGQPDRERLLASWATSMRRSEPLELPATG